MTMFPTPAVLIRWTRPVLLLGAIAWAGAEDLARWRDGQGTVGADAAKAGAAIGPAQAFAAAPASLGGIDLLTAPGSTLQLGPGAAASLVVERDAGGAHLIVVLERGAIEVHIADKGAYADVHVRGGAADVRVTGTLFVVERIRRDADYVALVNGHLKVTLRREVADALGKPGEVDLDARQGVSADAANGLGTVETLGTRPVLKVGDPRSIRDQARAPDEGGAGTGPGDGHLDMTDASTDAFGDRMFDDIDLVLGEQVLDHLLSTPELGGPPRPPR
jgi:hypothetical protein